MESRDQALKYLKRDYIQNIPAITLINRGVVDIIHLSEGGIILYDKNSDLYFVSVEDNIILDHFVKDIKHINSCILALRESNIEYLESITQPKRSVPCYQMVYTGKPYQYQLMEGLTIKALDISYLDIVTDNYSLKLDREYLEDRLKSNSIYGAFYNGILAGFAGRHDEGAMGLLEVFPSYRRLGIATALEHYMINLVLSIGETPYAHIIVTNQASLHLQEHFPDIKIAEEKISWLIYD